MSLPWELWGPRRKISQGKDGRPDTVSVSWLTPPLSTLFLLEWDYSRHHIQVLVDPGASFPLLAFCATRPLCNIPCRIADPQHAHVSLS